MNHPRKNFQEKYQLLRHQRCRSLIILTIQNISQTSRNIFQMYPTFLSGARYCKHIGFPDSFTQRIIVQQPVQFRGKLYSPEHNQIYSTEHSEAKLERDPEGKHRFMLKIDGVSVFQWFRNKAKEFLARLGIRPKEPRKGPSLGH